MRNVQVEYVRLSNMKKEDLILKEIKKPRGSSSRLIRYYECKCFSKDCTVVTFRDVYAFKNWSGFCKKCSDLKKINSIDRTVNTTAIRPFEALYNNLVKHAKARLKECSITYQDFVDFTSELNCHYCNSSIFWASVNLAKNGSRYNLDRKDNSIGYVKNNLVVCCWRCNNGRGNLFSYEEWYGMTQYLRNK